MRGEIELLGERLKALRKERKITQKELAEILSMDTSIICKYESGAAVPSYEALEKIANFFSISTDYLFGRESNHLIDKDDDDTEKFLEMMRTRPEFKILFDISKDATEQEIRQIIAIHKAMKDTNPNL